MREINLLPTNFETLSCRGAVGNLGNRESRAIIHVSEAVFSSNIFIGTTLET